LRARYLSGSKDEKNAIFADSLANLYREAGKFDSAGWFAEEASTFFHTKESFLKAGNDYYEGFHFLCRCKRSKRHSLKRRRLFFTRVEGRPGKSGGENQNGP